MSGTKLGAFGVQGKCFTAERAFCRVLDKSSSWKLSQTIDLFIIVSCGLAEPLLDLRKRSFSSCATWWFSRKSWRLKASAWKACIPLPTSEQRHDPSWLQETLQLPQASVLTVNLTFWLISHFSPCFSAFTQLSPSPPYLHKNHLKRGVRQRYYDWPSEPPWQSKD